MYCIVFKTRIYWEFIWFNRSVIIIIQCYNRIIKTWIKGYFTSPKLGQNHQTMKTCFKIFYLFNIHWKISSTVSNFEKNILYTCNAVFNSPWCSTLIALNMFYCGLITPTNWTWYVPECVLQYGKLKLYNIHMCKLLIHTNISIRGGGCDMVYGAIVIIVSLCTKSFTLMKHFI